MPLSTKTYDQFLSDSVTQWATILTLSPNLKSGDPILALFQAYVLAGLMFIQSQVVTVDDLTRMQTSQGADLDSFWAQFGFTRFPSEEASGSAQFSVNRTLGSNINIPVGTVIQTTDGSIQYQVVANTLNAAYNSGLNAYVLAAGNLNVSVNIEALTAGSASNVQANALVQLVSSVTGINAVTNLAPIQNGSDPETDAAGRTRFILMINTVNARTTPAGILSATLNTQGVVNAVLLENQDVQGRPLPGYGVVVIDDGSGAPPSSLINQVTQNVASQNAPCRGFCIQMIVIGPVLENVPITLNVKVSPSANQATVLLNVKNAVLDYVNSLEIGQPLYLDNVIYVARGADPGVITVQNGSVFINNQAADYLGTNKTVIRTNTALTNIGTA